jgi:hypothetical protein
MSRRWLRMRQVFVYGVYGSKRLFCSAGGSAEILEFQISLTKNHSAMAVLMETNITSTRNYVIQRNPSARFWIQQFSINVDTHDLSALI